MFDFQFFTILFSRMAFLNAHVSHCSVSSQWRRSKMEVVRQNFIVSSWQVLWTELDISIISDSNSVLEAAHARGSGDMPFPGNFFEF